METIARIPRLALPERAAVAPRARPASGKPWPRLPGASLTCLACLAVAAWALAAWHEQSRLARQRQAMRLAQEPAAIVRESITP